MLWNTKWSKWTKNWVGSEDLHTMGEKEWREIDNTVPSSIYYKEGKVDVAVPKMSEIGFM